MGDFKFELPTVVEQRRIAGVLGALDDKIEHNRKLVQDLELFSSNAVALALRDRREVRQVGELARFFNRKRVPLSAIERAERPGPYPYYGATGVFDYVDDYLFDGVYVLVGEDGSVVDDDGFPVVQFASGRFWVNNHAHVLQGHGISTDVLGLLLKRLDVRAYVTGAVQPKLSMRSLKSIQVDVPSEESLGRLERVIAPLLARRRSAETESQRVTAIRDALLPKLVSGKIRVPESYDPDDVLGTLVEQAAAS
jgi:type I restriction enzyme S subunit